MKLFASIILLCIIPVILCKPPTTQRPRERRRRTTTAYTDNSNKAIDGNAFLADEVLLIIFDCLSSNDLSQVRDVCQHWRRVVDTNTLPERVERLSELRIPENSPLTWQDYVSIYNVIAPQKNLWENVYNREFPRYDGRQPIVDPIVKDPDYWEVFPAAIISEVPNNAPKPENYIKRSFVTARPMKKQVMNLVQLGLPEAYLDTMQPKIQIREWAKHSDYRSLRQDGRDMQIKITLLNKDNVKLRTYNIDFTNNPSYANKWEEKILTLKNYGQGVRKIRIERLFTTMRPGSDIFIIKPARHARAMPRERSRSPI